MKKILSLLAVTTSLATTSDVSYCNYLFVKFGINPATKSRNGWLRIINNSQVYKYSGLHPTELDSKNLIQCIEKYDNINRSIGDKNVK